MHRFNGNKPGPEFKRPERAYPVPDPSSMSLSESQVHSAVVDIRNRRRVTAALSRRLRDLQKNHGGSSPIVNDHATADRISVSLENPNPVFTSIPAELSKPLAGSMNDAALIRAVLVRSIRHCNKSRELIAEEMSHLIGRKITERMLNAYTAESKEDNRWHAELDRAFCHVTGSDELLRCRADLAGLVLITKEEAEILELGRQYLRRKQAEAEMERLETALERRKQK